MDYKDIEKKVNKLTNVYSEPPIPVCEIIRQQGVKLYTADFKQFVDTFSGFCDFENDSIYLNQDDSRERKFVVAAHEFGHWFLHRAEFKKKPDAYAFLPRYREIADGSVDDIKEKQADYFALNLIMPIRLVEEFNHLYSVSELARLFNVPRSLMERRLKAIL